MREMFPHTVTLYTVVTEENPSTFEETTTNYITILRGVLLDAVKAKNVNESGLEGADSVALYVPKDVEAVDGVTGEEKQYVGPVEFWKMEDRSGFWTFSVGENSFFVKGEAVHPDCALPFPWAGNISVGSGDHFGERLLPCDRTVPGLSDCRTVQRLCP